jgi:hypothetical protein
MGCERLPQCLINPGTLGVSGKLHSTITLPRGKDLRYSLYGRPNGRIPEYFSIFL